MNKAITLTVFIAMLLVTAPRAFSHCEIPCGIYGDQTRFALLSEHIDTIEKSMKQIQLLTKEKTRNYNQIVRWVNAKEAHAEKIQHIVNQYFLTQRVKPVEKNQAGYENYLKQLTLLHEMLVYSMKAKQTTELGHIEKLKKLLADFQVVYKS